MFINYFFEHHQSSLNECAYDSDITKNEIKFLVTDIKYFIPDCLPAFGQLSFKLKYHTKNFILFDANTKLN